MDHNYPSRKEPFDVVLIKTEANDFTAKSEDFKRVLVEASDTIAAQADPACDIKGYRVIFVTKPGVKTYPEINARRREMEYRPQDGVR